MVLNQEEEEYQVIIGLNAASKVKVLSNNVVVQTNY